VIFFTFLTCFGLSRCFASLITILTASGILLVALAIALGTFVLLNAGFVM